MRHSEHCISLLYVSKIEFTFCFVKEAVFILESVTNIGRVLQKAFRQRKATVLEALEGWSVLYIRKAALLRLLSDGRAKGIIVKASPMRSMD